MAPVTKAAPQSCSGQQLLPAHLTRQLDLHWGIKRKDQHTSCPGLAACSKAANYTREIVALYATQLHLSATFDISVSLQNMLCA